VIVAHDFNLNLELYTLPAWAKTQVEKRCNVQVFDIGECSPKDVDIFWGNRITMPQLQDLPNLKWIHLGCSGTDRLDLNQVLTTHAFSRSSEILSVPVASTAIMFMYALGRGLQWAMDRPDRSTMDGRLDSMISVPHAKTLVLGRGSIAQEIQGELGSARCHLMPARRLSPLGIGGYDFVVNALPLREETREVVNREWFAKMSSSSYFINVGRGETVNEGDLMQALETKEIMGAGLDVVQNEPMDASNPLVQMKEVLATPHIAWYSKNYWADETELFARKLGRYRSKPTTGWV